MALSMLGARSILDDLDDTFAIIPRFSSGSFWPTTTMSAAVQPRVDLIEGEKEYKLHVDCPGMEKENVDVRIKNGVISISGERTRVEQKEESGYLIAERNYGVFRRSVRLPKNTDPEGKNICAKMEKGELCITIPKVSESAQGEQQGQKVPVQ